MDTKKLYVGSLSYQTTAADLQQLFSSVAVVADTDVIIIKDKETGRSKGFGFVTLPAEVAEQAIAEFNNYELDGRKLVVNEARPVEDRRPSGGGGFRPNGGGDRNGGNSRPRY